jgi:hypothetical protein
MSCNSSRIRMFIKRDDPTLWLNPIRLTAVQQCLRPVSTRALLSLLFQSCTMPRPRDEKASTTPPVRYTARVCVSLCPWQASQSTAWTCEGSVRSPYSGAIFLHDCQLCHCHSSLHLLMRAEERGCPEGKMKTLRRFGRAV